VRRYQFWRLYLRTGERSQGELDARDQSHFLQCLNAYNRQMPGAWQYWAEEAQLVGTLSTPQLKGT
jgi:hypothetical protein